MFLKSVVSSKKLFLNVLEFTFNFFSQGINLVWESYKLDTYVQRLAEAIFNFQEKMDDLVAMEEEIEVEVRNSGYFNNTTNKQCQCEKKIKPRIFRI